MLAPFIKSDVPTLNAAANLPEVLNAVMTSRLHSAVVVDAERHPGGSKRICSTRDVGCPSRAFCRSGPPHLARRPASGNNGSNGPRNTFAMSCGQRSRW